MKSIQIILGVLFISLLAFGCSSQNETKFEHVGFVKEYPLKDGKVGEDNPTFSYDASILWADWGTPEFKQWLLNSVALPNALTKSALRDTLEAVAQRENQEYLDLNADMELDQSYSLSLVSELVYSCPDYVSVETFVNRFDGGMHPEVISTLGSWSLSENKEIKREDVFKQDKEDLILPLIMKGLMDYWECKSINDVNDILDNGPLTIMEFALVQDSIDFFYPYYTIAPRVYGQPTVRIVAREIAPALTDFAKRLLNVEEISNINNKEPQEAILPHPHSARKGLGIYGNVRKVTDDKGNVIEFDKVGNILKEITGDGKYTHTYEYVIEYKKYKVNDFGFYNITYTDHERKDLSEIEGDTEGSVEYYFDDQDRIIKKIEHIRMSYRTTTFTYTGKKKLPDNIKVNDYDETGNYTTTEVYEYLKVDDQGNWLKRKVTETHENTIYENYDKEVAEAYADEPYIETRTIEYF